MDRQMEWSLVKATSETSMVHLEAEKRRIDEEIKNYPRPIAACDLQFNHLLEERARLAGELDRMDEGLKDAREAEPERPALA